MPSPPGAGPTVAIVGAQKAGTTSLFFLLAQHPDVFPSPVKEPGFFAYSSERPRWSGPGADRFAANLVLDPGEYSDLFRPGKGHQHRLEASTLYLSEPEAPKALAGYNPDAKVIIVLRDPVDRIYSAFNFLRLRQLEPCPSVLDALAAEPKRSANRWIPTFEYLRLSRYSMHLARYQEFFSPDNVLYVSYSELTRSPIDVMARVEVFLELRSVTYGGTDARHNPSGTPTSKHLHRALQLGTPRLRGRIRSLAPDWVHRTIVAARDRNIQRPSPLFEGDRRAVAQRLSGETAAVQRLGGQALVEDWRC